MMGAGMALLALAGERLVEFACALSVKARVSPAVVGLTVVAAGTSAPELFVSLAAALGGSPAIALGNVVGSNTANVALVLGACATVAAVPLTTRVLRFEYPVMVVCCWLLLLLCRDGKFDRLEGASFVLGMAAFVAYAVWVARAEISPGERREVAGLVPERTARLRARAAWLLSAGLLASLAGLCAGAHLMVEGAIRTATSLGVSERVVGLTVVAVGTSLPELVATVAAALKREHEMAVANVLGSNVFNTLMIAGLAGIVRPLPVERTLVAFDMWVMLAAALALFPLVAWDRKLSRAEGMGLLAAYAAYVAWVAARTAGR
jgi:cation:H+ antiporter